METGDATEAQATGISAGTGQICRVELAIY